MFIPDKYQVVHSTVSNSCAFLCLSILLFSTSALKVARDFFLQQTNHFSCADYSDNMVDSVSLNLIKSLERGSELIRSYLSPFIRRALFWAIKRLLSPYIMSTPRLSALPSEWAASGAVIASMVVREGF